MTDKERFIELWVANFLSNWAALNYTDYCMRGMAAELSNPPIEDAVFLAEEHWEKLQDVGN